MRSRYRPSPAYRQKEALWACAGGRVRVRTGPRGRGAHAAPLAAHHADAASACGASICKVCPLRQETVRTRARAARRASSGRDGHGTRRGTRSGVQRLAPSAWGKCALPRATDQLARPRMCDCCPVYRPSCATTYRLLHACASVEQGVHSAPNTPNTSSGTERRPPACMPLHGCLYLVLRSSTVSTRH